MNLRQSRNFGAVGLSCVLWAHAVSAAPISSAITYQGQLLDGGSPHPGPTAQMTFRLYNASAAGTLLGTVGPQAVPVDDGRFTVSLDFGNSAFTDEARWLEIQVAATTLSPRQQLMPVPFAHQTRGILVSHATGNVGIGTTSPGRLLQVGSSGTSNSQGMVRLASRSGTGASNRVWDMGVPETDEVTTGKGYSFVIDDTQLGTDPEFMVQWGTGNVGIGTIDPASNLEVSSNSTSITGLSLTNTSTGGSEYLLQSVGSGVAGRVGNFELWRVGASLSSLAVQPDGDVGIGTSTPSADLHLVGGSDAMFKVGSASTAQIQMGYSIATLGSYLAVKDGSGNDVILLTGVDGRMRSKVVEITGADLAEKFPVKEKVEPGMVVEIDPDHPGQLRLANGTYNRRVAGVVSGAGGLPAGAILGNLPGSEDHPPIAMTGRVWVHCDASAGAISPGDLLTTAETPGHAMKVEDYPRAQGAVIGKAMTELREGCGMVLVLVNLQ